MHDPSHYQPPELNEGDLLRDRLSDTLARRWERRAVVLVAGAGFGKSTALAQAVVENLLAPAGTDCWLRCTSGDAVPSVFVEALGAATGVELAHLSRDVDVALEELFDHLALRWPLGVCLVLDDAHQVVAEGGGSGDVLARLLRDAPANVHFLVASRTTIPGLARLRSRHEVVDLDESDLRFDDAELAALAAPTSVEASTLEGLEGWPALTTLALRSRERTTTSLDDGGTGVLRAAAGLVDEAQRRAIALIGAVGSADPDVQRVVIGADPGPVLRGVPLVARHQNGALVPHQLWERILEGEVDPATASGARRTAARFLLDRGDDQLAAPLFADAGDWSGFRDAVAVACSRGYAGPAPDILASWLDRLPAHMHDEPEGLLLRGVTARAAAPFAEATRDVLEQAMLGFRAQGGVAGEVAALMEYVYVARARGETERIPPTLFRLLELDAAGERAVEGPVRLGRALVAEAAGQDEEFLNELAAIPSGSMSNEWMAVVEYLIAQAHVHLGQVQPAVAAADRSARFGGPRYIGGKYAAALMRWYAGDPTTALELPMAGTLPGATPVDLLYTGMYGAMVDAMAGRIDRARTNLEIGRRSLADHATPLMQAEFVGAEAAVLVAEGDEDGAASLLRQHLDTMPISSAPCRRALSRFYALVHVLVPEVRDDLAAAANTPLHVEMRALADVLVSLRAGGPKPIDTTLDVDPALLSVRLPLRWAVEVAVGLVEAGAPGARDLLAGLGAIHGTRLTENLRDRASEGDRVARRVLRTVVVDGGASIEVDILGPLAVRLDGSPTDSGELRRGPVRMLLAHLAASTFTTRDQLMTAIWPDHGTASAANNLRVALSQLHKVLEPHREKGEAPFFVRTEHDRIELIGRPHVTVDAARMVALVDEGDRAREDGVPSEARDRYEAAIGWWRGDPLVELPDIDRVLDVRAQLRTRFVHAALGAAELRLASGEPDAAVAHAGDALAVEPWSERAYQVIAAAHVARGDRPSAQRALDRCATMLSELGVSPSVETRMLDRLVRRGGVVPDRDVAS